VASLAAKRPKNVAALDLATIDDNAADWCERTFERRHVCPANGAADGLAEIPDSELH
jgi:hypothetical protein